MTEQPPEAVEAGARALYVVQRGPWISGGGIQEGGTPWGTSRERDFHAEYLGASEAALTAAAPFMRRAWLEELVGKYEAQCELQNRAWNATGSQLARAEAIDLISVLSRLRAELAELEGN